MTSLNPSHFPSIGFESSNDRTHGAASHLIPSDTAALPPDSDADDLDSPTSSFFEPKELPHRIPAFRLPDLRFEQGYLMSLMPFFHFDDYPSESSIDLERTDEKTDKRVWKDDRPKDGLEAMTKQTDSYYLGPNFRVEWKMVIYVTLRDQLIYPLLQGCLWGSASLFLTHLWALRSTKPKPISSEVSQGSIVGKPGTLWERIVGSIWGGIQTNVTLS